MWVDQGPVKFTQGKVRVICIPQAGMGAWAFHAFVEPLSQVGVEVLPVELPGRNTRMLEEKPREMHATVRDLVRGLGRELTKPYVLMGHSLGAFMAYEAARFIQQNKLPRPLGLVVSGARAPHLTESGGLSHLASDDFWEAFEERYGKNPDLQGDMVRSYVEPLLRADFELLETYVPKPGLLDNIPVVACGANGDTRFTHEQLEAWREHTTGKFQVKRFDVTPLPWSTPHRYIVEDPKEFIGFLGDFCLGLIAPPEPGIYIVAAKKGALVRETLNLDSEQVTILPQGTECTVVEITNAPKPRARIESPVVGWLTLSTLNHQ